MFGKEGDPAPAVTKLKKDWISGMTSTSAHDNTGELKGLA